VKGKDILKVCEIIIIKACTRRIRKTRISFNWRRFGPKRRKKRREKGYKEKRRKKRRGRRRTN
jgi:hypothetical protein